MGGRGALLKGLWRAQLQRSRAHQACSYIARRSMSSRLFVGGLSFTTEEEGLRTAFSKYGEVVDARIVTDRESGRSRGFAFVTFLNEADADTAKDKLNGQWLDGRVIRVDRATPRPAPPPPPPRLNVPPPDEQPSPQDWGSIPSPIAAVPQNAGLVQSTGATVSSELPSLSSLASASPPPPPITGSFPPPPPPPSTPVPPPVEPPRSTFNFNLDLSTPDPNYVPRPRPPRIRPSMMDYEFGLFSDTSKFPFNTNFGTGFLKVRGPEAEFDFSDIKEALAQKKAAELAAKQAAEAEAAAVAKEAEEAAAKQALEAEAATTESSPVVVASSNQPQQGSVAEQEEAVPGVAFQFVAAANGQSQEGAGAAENNSQEATTVITSQVAAAAVSQSQGGAVAENESQEATQVVVSVASSQPQEGAVAEKESQGATPVGTAQVVEATNSQPQKVEVVEVKSQEATHVVVASAPQFVDAVHLQSQTESSTQYLQSTQVTSIETSQAVSLDPPPSSVTDSQQANASELRQVGL